MKRALIIIPSILVVLLAVAVIAPGFMDWNQYKPQAQQQVKAMTGLDLELAGDIGFTILPSPRIMAEKVTIKAPEGSKAQTLASVERLDVNVDLMPLLSGQVSVKYVTLVKPEINLEKLESGKLNAMTPELEALQSGQGEASAKSAGPEISLDKLVIDNGTFSFYDHAAKTETIVRNINADLKAQTLEGPYEAAGSLFYEGHAAEFDLKAAKIDPQTGQLQPKLKLTLRPADLEISYTGTLNTKDPVGGQGVLSASAPSLGRVLEQFKLGALAGKDTPLKMKGVLTADTAKIDYRDFEISLGDEPLSGSFGLLFDPLKYAMEIKAPKGVQVAKIAPQLPMFKTAIFNVKLEGDAKSAKIHPSDVKLDAQEFKLSGTYSAPGKSGRAKADIDFSTGSLDYDALAAKMSVGKDTANADLESSLRSVALPLDLDLGVNAGKLKYQGQNLEKVGANLKFRENAFSFSGVSVKNFASADITASGEIKDVASASGITLDLAVNARDARELAKALKLDASGLPEQVKAVNLKTRLTGSAKAMDMTANVAALNGEFIAQGKIGSPMKTATLEDLALQVKHKNMAELIQKISGAAEQDASLAKPMDIYAKITQTGKTYDLKGLKGDLAGFTVQGDAKVDASGAKPYLTGNLKFGKVVLASGVTSGKPGGKPGVKGERWSKDPIDAQALHALNADLAISATSITYGPWPLIAPEMKIALKDGVLNVSDMKAGLFEGALAMNATVESAAQPRQPLHIASKASLNGVSLAQLIRALAGSQMIDASGKVNGDLDITTSGTSAAALVYDLGGQGVVTGSEIVLKGVDVKSFATALSDESKPGDSVLGLWQGSTRGGQTAFDTLDGNYVIREGVITIQKLDLDGPEANIATTGTINLPQWTLATKHKITVKPQGDVPADVPPFEMSFSGSLDNPAQTFGQGVLQDYLNRKISRKFEKMLGDKIGIPGQKDQQNTPQEVLPSSGQEPEQHEPKKELTPDDIIRQVLDPHSSDAPPPEEPPAEQPAQQEPPAQQQKPKEPDAEDVVKDVLKGLLR